MKSASIQKKLATGLIGALLLLLYMVGSAAALQGLSSGIFVNAQPSGAVVGGEGTSTLTWGTPLGTPPSRLIFTGINDPANPIDISVNDLFYIGTLDYYNGTITSGTGAESVDFQVTVTFTDLGGEVQTVTQNFELVNTPNIAGDDEASADYVYLRKDITEGATSSDSTFEIDGQQYALHIYGFGEILGGSGFQRVDSFHVYEDNSASAELIGRVTPVTCTVEPTDTEATLSIWQLIEEDSYKSCGTNPFVEFDVITSQNGQRITFQCLNNQYLFYFYENGETQGQGTKVGECSFEGGSNDFVFTYVDSNNGNPRPKCFLTMTHRGRDYGDYNDKRPVNPWTQVEEPNEQLLDHAITVYHVNSKFRSTLSEKYNYINSIWLETEDGWDYYRVRPETITIPPDPVPEDGTAVSTTVGFYDAPPQVKGQPMRLNPNPICDIDQDGDCDQNDLSRFQASIGTCRYEAGFDSRFDIDASGCVDADDHFYLFVQDIDNDGVHDAIDNAPRDPNPDQADSDGDGIGDAADTFFDLSGDIDNDGDVDRDDVNYVRESLNKPPVYCPECDVDQDGAITILDARKIVTMCTCPKCVCCP